MVIFEYTAFIILSIYSLIIIGFSIGWLKIERFRSKGNFDPISVSIIVACRNEEENIQQLLDCLVAQNYPKNKTEIIIIDDHSEDNTVASIKRKSVKNSHINYLQLPPEKTGKKEAIAYGIENSTSEIILTTDADCEMKENWISSMVGYYINYQPKLLSGPITLKKTSGLFQNFQSLEFLSLVASGAGAIGINRPIMNNGANLLFEKTLFLESNQYKSYASGDDIFLMLHAKKKYRERIHFIKSKNAIVYTYGLNKISRFFNQRIRWTSKSKAYRDFDIIFTAIIVSLINLMLVLSILLSFWEKSFLLVSLIIFLTKSLVDLMILIPVSSFFSKQNLLWLFFPLQAIYPFYILVTVTLGLIGNFNWKNRTFREKG